MPAILEYLPYRQRDLTAERDALTHPYVAGPRLRLRPGRHARQRRLRGVLTDEYLPHEQDDAVEVIAWLAAQPWCTGRVGMMGNSWGGFNALQVAARRPPALGAIITVLLHRRPLRRRHPLHGRLPPDRQPPLGVDDVRPQLAPARPGGGRRRAGARCGWSASAAAGSGSRPGCATSGATPSGSRARCARTSRPSSARSSRSAAGSTATRTRSRGCCRGSTAPRQGLIGPVGARYPHMALPGPAVGFLQDSPSAGGTTGSRARRPAIAASRCSALSCRRACRPAPLRRDRPGRWVGERGWPSPRITPPALRRSTARRLAPETGARGGRSRSGRRRLSGSSGPLVPLRRHPGSAARPAGRGRRLAHLRHRSRCAERIEILGAPVPSSSSRSTGRWRSSPRGSPTSRPTGAPRASATAC